ncbi:HNH endonuclease [Staphylococcus xylosus]|nr:HNH endonuclease [Staphylococcus xylosus]
MVVLNMPHIWTEDEKQFLRDNVQGTPIHDLTKMFNEHFDTNLTYTQIRGTVKRLKLKCGVSARFTKGHVTWNKGIPIYNKKCEKTQFKKGNKPKTTLPIGAERINSYGYVVVKVSNEGGYNHRWKLKHKVIWEEKYGKVPPKHNLIFLDGDKTNNDLSNIALIKRSELARLNHQNLIYSDAELTRTSINIVKIQNKIAERNK